MSTVVEKIARPKKKTVATVKVKHKTQEEKQVIVHCVFEAVNLVGIRIWKSTYLIAHENKHRSKLLHAENICLPPKWLWLDPGQRKKFTLIFEALPKDCIQFDFEEKLPRGETDGFRIPNIKRNKADVYYLNLSSGDVIF